jgi:hypothetical protein
MSNLSPTALNLQRILDAYGIEGLAQSLARKDERIQSARVAHEYKLKQEIAQKDARIAELEVEIKRLGRLLDHRPLPTSVVGWAVG